MSSQEQPRRPIIMKTSSASSRRYMRILLALGDYPVLSDKIRELMREEMFKRCILQCDTFDAEVREMALRSQRQEGVQDPLQEEDPSIWNLRVNRIRDHLTDLRFSQNLSFEIFESLVNDVLSKRGMEVHDLSLSLNLELAPMELVFEYARTVERLPHAERVHHEAGLQQAKAVLIRYLISDQLRYINIAREWLTIDDLADIRAHKIGAGRIGGKAAGMVLAYRILANSLTEDAKVLISTPESYYIGSGEYYTFVAVNDLTCWNNQKYKPEDEMRAEHPRIIEEYEAGKFPNDTMDKLAEMLTNVRGKPLIVRSSSLLEDNFGTSFAGKYESVFLPNQGTLDENLTALVRGMAHVYASTLNPSALLYRRARGLQDYDERMAILVQVVEGEAFQDYYMPYIAGVAFSRNTYRWTPQIRREDGFVRMVWGLGTRAVDRVGNDYPRVVALSHPMLRPSNEPKSIRRYSQQYVDLIDLKNNAMTTLPASQVLSARYPNLRYIAQLEESGYFTSLRSNILDGEPQNLVLTFDELLRRTSFSEDMRAILRTLEQKYRFPVDVEFTMRLENDSSGKARPCITILQCRPQSQLEPARRYAGTMPRVLRKNIVFSSHFVVPEGYVDRIDYVAFIPPEEYFALPTAADRIRLARGVGRLNAALKDQSFILVGPGRWGSSNSDLGVPIEYGDIYNSAALVELTGKGIGMAPEPSLGTHFFQDLMEAQIYPLAIYLDDPHSVFRRSFFYKAPNCLQEWLPQHAELRHCLRLIAVGDYRPQHCLRLILNEEKSLALAFLVEEG